MSYTSIKLNANISSQLDKKKIFEMQQNALVKRLLQGLRKVTILKNP